MLKYYHFLDKGDYAQVSKVIDDLENYVPDKWSKSDLRCLRNSYFIMLLFEKMKQKRSFMANHFAVCWREMRQSMKNEYLQYWLFFEQKDRGAALQYTMKTLKQISSYHLTDVRNWKRNY